MEINLLIELARREGYMYKERERERGERVNGKETEKIDNVDAKIIINKN